VPTNGPPPCVYVAQMLGTLTAHTPAGPLKPELEPLDPTLSRWLIEGLSFALSG
jgi:hypothetical protein